MRPFFRARYSTFDHSHPIDSIPTAISQLKEHGPSFSIQFDNTEDSAQFSDDTLAAYDGILFLMVTDISPNDILNSSQQAAFQQYLNKGGNFIGVHAASDCLHDVSFYGREVGAYFLNHPPLGQAVRLLRYPGSTGAQILMTN